MIKSKVCVGSLERLWRGSSIFLLWVSLSSRLLQFMHLQTQAGRRLWVPHAAAFWDALVCDICSNQPQLCLQLLPYPDHEGQTPVPQNAVASSSQRQADSPKLLVPSEGNAIEVPPCEQPPMVSCQTVLNKFQGMAFPWFLWNPTWQISKSTDSRVP